MRKDAEADYETHGKIKIEGRSGAITVIMEFCFFMDRVFVLASIQTILTNL